MKHALMISAIVLAAACAGAPTVFAAPSSVAAAAEAPSSRTDWRIATSVGLDALVFLGALSGDALQSEVYVEEAAEIAARFNDDERAAVAALADGVAAEDNLVGPWLALVFSVGDTGSLEAVIAAAEDPETHLRAGFEQTPYWDEADWPAQRDLIAGPGAASLRALERVGFEEYWATKIEALNVAADISRFEAALTPHDVIAEQERLLGRDLDNEIELILMLFSKPYGIRITGQRFLSHHSYPADIQLSTAAHEIFHPPFDRNDEALLASLAPLRDDPWMVSIVEDHDPRFGYNTFLGVLDEDSAEALDQIVSERLGFAHDAGGRWTHHDGGMHMLAAALYKAMKNDGFDETGGRYEDWLKRAIARGVLEPENVKRLAAEVVGDEAVAKWEPGEG